MGGAKRHRKFVANFEALVRGIERGGRGARAPESGHKPHKGGWRRSEGAPYSECACLTELEGLVDLPKLPGYAGRCYELARSTMTSTGDFSGFPFI
jgi:hypothetical protein